MTYFITFLEGVLSFLSPCMLPLLPVYLSYFAGNADKEGKGSRIPAFLLGFTLSFMVLGLLFSALGTALARHQAVVNLVCGVVMILFGLSCLNVIHLPQIFSGTREVQVVDSLSAFLFGIVYPLNLTPCVGAFLGSALALATASGSAAKGALLLLVYSFGLGMPFVLSAHIISHLDSFFTVVKSHYAVVNRVSGGLLIIAGLLTASGLLGRWMRFFA